MRDESCYVQLSFIVYSYRGGTMRFNCRCGKPDCTESASTALRFKIFNEGIKNNRQKMMAKAKMKPRGSMTDIAKKLGIKIEEDFLAENTLIESKADQQKFIDKFGKEFFDIFWNFVFISFFYYKFI